MRLTLNTLENSRKTFARVLRAYNRDDLPERKYRNLVYGLANFLSYWKLEKELEIEDEIEAIKNELEARKNEV